MLNFEIHELTSSLVITCTCWQVLWFSYRWRKHSWFICQINSKSHSISRYQSLSHICCSFTDNHCQVNHSLPWITSHQILSRVFFSSTINKVFKACKRGKKNLHNSKYTQNQSYFSSNKTSFPQVITKYLEIKRSDLAIEKRYLEKEILNARNDAIKQLLEERLANIRDEIQKRPPGEEKIGGKFPGIFSYFVGVKFDSLISQLIISNSTILITRDTIYKQKDSEKQLHANRFFFVLTHPIMIFFRYDKMNE